MFDFDFDGMHLLLGIVMAVIAFSFWRKHRNTTDDFSLFDLVMENGKASKQAFCLMVSFGVMTWVMIDLEIKGKMTEMYMAGYGAIWVAPLIARVIYGKTDPPALPAKTGRD